VLVKEEKIKMSPYYGEGDRNGEAKMLEKNVTAQ
jgi:hypothetical protein